MIRRPFWRRVVEGANAAVDVRVIAGGTVVLDVCAGPVPEAAVLTPAAARRLAINLLAAAYEAEIAAGLRP